MAHANRIRPGIDYSISFIFLLYLIVRILVFSFSRGYVLIFYISFEVVLIPIGFLILGWGYQPERLQATIYMLIYTISASFPLLVGLIYVYHDNGSLHFLLQPNTSTIIWNFKGWELIFILAFLVKLPIFCLHLWLPKAHVEAPVVGSIILAGVLLKLGGYGLLRIGCYISIGWNGIIYEILMVIGLWGGILTRFLCLRQIDIKALVAYSSIGHIRLVLGGCLSNCRWGWQAAVIIIVAHGLCSSGLFAFCIFRYQLTQSRSLLISKGILSIAPILSIWWFLLSTVNIGAPPSLNLIREILLIGAIIYYSWWLLIPVFLICFLAAAFSLYLYVSTQHGRSPQYILAYNYSNYIPFLVGFLHWFPVNILVLIIEEISSCI